MAVVISIKVGAATPVKAEFQNEEKAVAILERFYTDHNLGPSDATARQKLQAIVDWIPTYIADKAELNQLQLAREAERTKAKQDNTFE